MNDREMLELAAKAAGIKIDCSDMSGGRVNNEGFDLNGNAVLDWHNGTRWNPLADDGDAFRLGVKLGLTINPYKRGLFVSRYENEPVIQEKWAEDGCVTTRRAIVRAAAEIGKQMGIAR